ncbi:MAG: sulfate adenylyltransferase [Firmicutes bacterium HGW-Firmicutes-1]|jgi:bifunctional enzyme CysN/CysC/sulfate adenylyltransferase subunit 1|nr:MAG: sulfate adenylyltransferase [Firmicutes bacterium HGW-Firmicutes-1]
MSIDREKLKIVVVGHVDHGKSTVIGRLLYDTKSVTEGKIDRVKKVCKEKGKPFEYAYLLDAFEEEQKQGITIDTTQLQFFTKKRDYVIIDAPGHKEFLKNMISGAANAEAALLIIDAKEGVQEQSKRHGYILSLLGIQKVYVIVNKMDLIDYSEEKFNIIKQEMNGFLNSLHVYPLKYIPISAFYGENLTSRSDKMAWYNDEPILEAIDLIEKDKGLEDKPLRFPIQDVYKFDHRRIIAGRIESGTIHVGDEILISPSNKKTKVKSIEYFQDKDNKDFAEAGMSVGITVEDEFFNKRGEFISHFENKPIVDHVFKANLFWMGKNVLVKDKKYKLKISTQEVECEIIVINKVIDATNLIISEDAIEVKTNDVAEVTIKTKEDISFDEFKHNQNTGRFVLVEGYDVCGGGIISKLEKGIEAVSKFVGEDIEFKVQAFDEYFFVLEENIVKRSVRYKEVFRVGHVVPIVGESYEYPVSMNFIDLEQGVVAKIRKAILDTVIRIENYAFDEQEIFDANGFYVKVSTIEEFIKWQGDYEKVINHDMLEEDYANKWLDIEKYRKIRFKSTLEKTIDYMI